MHTGVSAPLSVPAALEAQVGDLALAGARLRHVSDRIAGAGTGGWSGPASRAVEAAVAAVRERVVSASACITEALTETQRLAAVARALAEADAHVR